MTDKTTFLMNDTSGYLNCSFEPMNFNLCQIFMLIDPAVVI